MFHASRDAARRYYLSITSTLLVAIGLWLVVAALGINYNNVMGAAASTAVIGIILSLLGLVIARAKFDATPITWVTTALGIWLAVSPFVLGFTGSTWAMVNNIYIGFITILISALTASEASGVR